MSEVTEAFTGHTNYYKVKYMLPVDEALTDTLKAEHPILGTFPVYLSYERIPKVCLFCAYIGHEHDMCPDKQRMERLMVDPRYRNNPEMKKLAKPTLGPWINDPSLIPPIAQIGKMKQAPTVGIPSRTKRKSRGLKMNTCMKSHQMQQQKMGPEKAQSPTETTQFQVNSH